MSFLNENGLVNGLIPAGHPCPFYKACAALHEICPTDEHKLQVDFSCAFARAWSITKGK